MLRTFAVCSHPVLISTRLLILLFISDRVLTPGGTDVTHIFFPTRSIPYENASQLEDPNNYDRIEAHKETDKDREKLKKWLNYINANTRGNPFSSSKFEFSVILERVDTSKPAFTAPSMRFVDKFR